MTKYDVVIAGGGCAGLSAALVLGRARRRVLVIDNGVPRNGSARAMHGFFSRDGADPNTILADARAQLAQYSSVECVSGLALDAERTGDGFLVEYNGEQIASQTLIVATGVRDALPEIDGLHGLWSKSVFTCPYCDGWEVRDARLAAFGTTRSGVGLARELYQWSRDLVVCSDLCTTISPEERSWVEAQRIPVKESPIRRLLGNNGALSAIEFEDGERIERDALFLSVPLEQASGLAEALGCNMTVRGQIDVDNEYRTSVPGAYAAGDAVTHMHQVVFAAASGARAAIALNNDLMEKA